MNNIEYLQKKKEVIEKFHKEFLEGNYYKDPILHNIIETLIRDGNPYDIIEKLIIHNQELQLHLQMITKQMPPRIQF